MAEYMWAKIEIGGEISRPIITYLVEKFGISPEAVHHLEREDTEARWGQFEELETYLVEQAIPFDRLSDGRYEYSPELRQFRPAITDADGKILQPETDRTFLCDHDNRPTAALADVDKAIAETTTREELVLRLMELCGLDIPGLPPLVMM